MDEINMETPPVRTEIEDRELLAMICKKYHEQETPCEGCPIDDILILNSISIDTYERYYVPFYGNKCKKEN